MRRNTETEHQAIDQQIGQNLKRLRIERGLSQVALAKAVGITFQQVQKYERGKNRIGGSRFVVLSRVLGVPIIDFFADSVRETPIPQTPAHERRRIALIRELNTLNDTEAERVLQDIIRLISKHAKSPQR